MTAMRSCAVLLLALMSACRNPEAQADVGADARREEIMDASPPDPPDPPVEAKTIPIRGDLPVYYVAGRRNTTQRMVFFHGACTHGLGYIQSFAFAASVRGSLLALQGEKDCGHGLRLWTGSAQEINARIDAAFAAAQPSEVRGDGARVAIGYSQGASVAESLAARYPTTYRRLILIGAPRPVDARKLGALEGAVLMAGTFDNRAVMKESALALERVGIPSTFLEIPNARHGQLLDAEAIMGKALAWLDEHAKTNRDAGAPR
jgi:alpha-beta hydrolase superfamily lysophospholipase